MNNAESRRMLYSVQMSAITVEVPDDLAARLRQHEEGLREILELGLREFDAGAQPGFQGAASVLEFLAGLPTPEEILTLRPSEDFERQVRQLLDKSRSGQLTPQEEQDWERYQFIEHIVRLAKTKACLKRGVQPGPDA
jgi:hypothetical protein